MTVAAAALPAPSLSVGQLVPIEQVVALSIVLFSIGVVGILARRNVLVMLLSLELMLNAAILGLVAFGSLHGDLVPVFSALPGLGGEGVGSEGFGGESFGIIAVVFAVGQVAVALAVLASWLRGRDTLDVDDVSSLKW